MSVASEHFTCMAFTVYTAVDFLDSGKLCIKIRDSILFEGNLYCLMCRVVNVCMYFYAK